MSDNLFRVGEELTAAKLNRVMRDVAADASDVSARGVVRTHFGRTLDEFGTVDRTGSQDVSTIINAAIAATAAEGVPLIVGPGTYRCEDRLIFRDGLHLQASSRATFERRYSASTLPFVFQPDRFTPIKIRVVGGRWWNPDPGLIDFTGINGNMFDLHLEDSEMSDMFIDEWGYYARALFLAGKRIRINRVRAVSLGEGGGFRLNGVEDTIVSNCYCACGDDLFMFATTGNPDGVYAGWHNRNSHYINCAGISYDARLCIAGAFLSGGTMTLTSETTDCSWTGIRGKGRLAVFIGNNLSSGEVARITVRDVKVDCTEYALAGAPAVDIRCDAGTGGVRDVLLDDVCVIGSHQETLHVQGPCERVVVRGGYYGPPTAASNWPVLVDNGAEVTMRDTHIKARSDRDGIKVGGTGDGPRFAAQNVTISGIADGWDGIVLTDAAAARVENCRFQIASGATTARAMIVSSGCENVFVGPNDYDQIPIAVKVSWAAASMPGCRIEAPATIVGSASVTTRAYLSGATYVLTGSTLRTLNLPSAGTGMRYRAVQAETGGWRVSASSGDVIRAGTVTSTAGGYIESGSAGATVDLVALDDTTWQAIAISGTWTAA